MPETVSIIVWTLTVGVMVAISILDVITLLVELEDPFVADVEVVVSEDPALVVEGESVDETGVLTEAFVPVLVAVDGVLVVVGESAAFEVGVVVVFTVVVGVVDTAFGEVVVPGFVVAATELVVSWI